MKKMVLAVCLLGLGMASNVFAASQYDWSGIAYVEMNGHYFEAAHIYVQNGWHGVCFGSGVGKHTNNVDALPYCAGRSVKVSGSFNDWAVMNPEGLKLTYTMTKEQFRDAFFRSDLRYVG